MIVRTVCTGAFAENCHIVADPLTREALVIDPGEGAEAIASALSEEGLKPLAVANTHAHLDHIAGVQAIKDRFGIPFWLHPDDAFWLEAAPEAARSFGLSFGAVPAVDRWLKPGERLRVGGLAFEVRHTPGHTPGHVCFVGEGAAFVGDVLFAGSIGRTDLPGGNYATLIRSIQSELLTLPDATAVHAGHMGPTTIGQERRENPFLLEPERYGPV